MWPLPAAWPPRILVKRRERCRRQSMQIGMYRAGPHGRQHGAQAGPARARPVGVEHHPRAVRGSVGRRRRGGVLARGPGRPARAAPRGVADAAGRRGHRGGGRSGGGAALSGRRPPRRRKHVLQGRRPSRRAAGLAGRALPRRGDERRHLGAGARLLPHDRRPTRGGGTAPPIFEALAPGDMGIAPAGQAPAGSPSSPPTPRPGRTDPGRAPRSAAISTVARPARATS